MLFNLLGKMFSRRTRRSADKRRRGATFRPEICALEDRLTPAVVGTLTQSGSYLLYTAMSATNGLTLSGTSPNLTITATSGTIQSTVPGHVTTAASISLAPIPATVTSIIINNGGTGDIVNLNGLSTTRALQVTSPFINIPSNLTAGSILLSGSGQINISANVSSNANAAGGAIDFNGPVVVSGTRTISGVSVTDGDTYFLSTVSGSGSLNFAAVTAPNLGGSVTFVGAVNLGGTVTIGDAAGDPGANNVTFDNTLTVNGGLDLSANNAMQFSGNVSATGPIALWANQDGSGNQGFSQSGTMSTTNATATAVRIEVNSTGGTGNATIGTITTGAGGTVSINSASTNPAAGGAILDGNGTAVNISTGAGGTFTFNAGLNVNLDTSTANISGSSATGDVVLRNTGLALASVTIFTAGNISVSNNAAIDLGNGTGFLDTSSSNTSITITTTGANNITLDAFVLTSGGGITVKSGGNIIIDSANAFVAIFSAYNVGTATLTAAGTINMNGAASTGTVYAPTVDLTAGTGIGNTFPVVVGTFGGNTTVNASTTSGGIAVTDNSSTLTVASAVAGSGAISLSTTGANDLHITGNITTASGGAITLASGQNLFVDYGTVSTDSGNITLTPTQNLSIATYAVISTDVSGTGTIVVSAPTVATDEEIDGTLEANGNITINGADGATTFMDMFGTIATGGTFTVQSQGVAAVSTFVITGTVIAGSGSQLIDSVASANDQYTVAPSINSAFNFDESGFAFVLIATAISNIQSSTQTSPVVTFTPASGFQAWTNTGTGTYLVLPAPLP